MCVGCGERVAFDSSEASSPLVRLILAPEGAIAVDPGNGGFGRGAHVHARPECLAKAVQRGLPRAARGRVHSIYLDDALEPSPALPEAPNLPEGADPRPEVETSERTAGPRAVALTAETLALAIRQAMTRRVEGLIRSAVRSRAAAIGADAASQSLDRGAPLAVVACDAAAGSQLSHVQSAIASGRAVAWGTKVSLGKLAGGRREQGVAVMAITSVRLASAILDSVHVADACMSVEQGTVRGVKRPARRPREESNSSEGGNKRAETGESRQQAESPRAHAAEVSGATGHGEARKSLQRGAPRRKHEAGASNDEKMSARGGTGSDAAARRSRRGWARRTGNVERGA
ncbi:YlxR family protein [Chondromyces crocatus]